MNPHYHFLSVLLILLQEGLKNYIYTINYNYTTLLNNAQTNQLMFVHKELYSCKYINCSAAAGVDGGKRNLRTSRFKSLIYHIVIYCAVKLRVTLNNKGLLAEIISFKHFTTH